MEVGYVISQLKEFFDLYYKQKISSFNDEILNIDYKEISEFDIELTNYLDNNPIEIQKLFSIAFEDFFKDFDKQVPYICLINLPKDIDKVINKIRKEDMNKLISIRGIIQSRSSVNANITGIKFECPSCGNIICVTQEDELKEPSRCVCGRKGKFRILKKEFEDILFLKIEELPERLNPVESAGSIPIILRKKLCNKDYNFYLGCRIEFIGYITERIRYQRNKKTTICDYVFEANSYNILDYVDFETEITKEEQELYEDIKQHNNPALLISRFIFSGIVGCSRAKQALIYQQFCGKMFNGYRDYIHILLYGMPGTAKTDLAIRVSKINPICKVTSGPDISKVGFTAMVEKDELSGKFVMKAGLLPRCSGGLAVIDEMEKAPEQSISGLHTPMEQGFLGMEKAGISAKIVAETSITATANPKSVEKTSESVGNFKKVSLENCNLPLPILDRFDLIFTFNDHPDTKKDEMIAKKIIYRNSFDSFEDTFEGNENTLSQNQNTFQLKEDTFWHKGNTFHISTLRKYIYLCKKVNPKLSIRVEKTISTWYVNLRQASTFIGYENKRPTPRVVESILRLARAIARSKQKDIVSQKELEMAISYYDFIYDIDNIKNPQVVNVED